MGHLDPSDELEKLIALAKQDASTDIPELNEAQSFIIACGIKEGDAKITPTGVWNVYKKWCESLGKKALGRRMFSIQFSKCFIQRSESQFFYRFYRLNPEPFDLSLDGKFRLHAQLREERARAARRRKKKGVGKKDNPQKSD